MEQVLIDLVTDDETGLRLVDRRNRIILEIFDRVLDAVGDCIDIIWIGEDLGSQTSPLVSGAIFKKHIRPRHQKFVDLAKKHRKKVMIHCCGSSSWAFDEFIDMGIDIIDTLQPEATNMSPSYLKMKFGDKLSFHGCISTAGVLAYGTVDDVVANVKQTLETMMPGGGYLMAPTHWIQDNTPPKNVVAMYEAARRYGVYKPRY